MDFGAVGICLCGLRQLNSRSSFRTAIIHVHAAAGCMGFTRSSGEFSLGPGRRLLPIPDAEWDINLSSPAKARVW